jgi:hypothetical protein
LEQRRKYLEILRIEVDDLAGDITALEDHTRERRARDEITDYVLKENVALLERESHGIAAVRACLASVQPGDYGSLDALIRGLEQRLDECIRAGAFDPVVRALVAPKLAKVARYVRGDVPAPPAQTPIGPGPR